MKNLSLVLNVILIVAVAILFYFQFKTTTPEVEESGESASKDYKVAYINSDSVLQNYDYFEVLQEELTAKSQKLEGEYQNRAQGLQKEVNDYQRNINNLTIGQAKALEEDLVKKQQNLRLYQESLSQQLLKEEARISQELYTKITDFLKDYSDKNGIELVVKYNQGSDVLYATEGMDITKDVVAGLNAEYEASKSESKETVSKDSTSTK